MFHTLAAHFLSYRDEGLQDQQLALAMFRPCSWGVNGDGRGGGTAGVKFLSNGNREDDALDQRCGCRCGSAVGRASYGKALCHRGRRSSAVHAANSPGAVRTRRRILSSKERYTVDGIITQGGAGSGWLRPV